ncbi:MAG TPA: TrbI/VirB10 family protein, partial [Mycobacterium sp.]|nr:TrbI/VirB10 family protein [Mycobacterium sp.]
MADQPTTSAEPAPVAGRIVDHRQFPPGVVPRHLQQWALLGIAIVMIGILALSGPAPKPHATTPPAPAATTVDPNQERIEDYQRRIQEQAQRLVAEQAQLEQAKQALVSPPDATGRAIPRRSNADPLAAGVSVPSARDANDSRIHAADSVAFSRTTTHAVEAAPATGPTAADSLGLAPLAHLLATAASVPSNVPTAAATVPPVAVLAPTAPANRLTSAPTVSGDAQYTLFEGTVIETVLTNRLDGTLNGPVNCLVSVPVYAADHLVIPAGARVLGEATAVNTFGQSRLA